MLICQNITTGENALLSTLVSGARQNTEETKRVTFSVSVIDLMKIKYISDRNMSLASIIYLTCTHRHGPMIWRHKWK